MRDATTMDAITLLQTRNSAPRLTDPAPAPEQRQALYQAALRAPDHAWLRPSRFIEIEGDARGIFGEALERALLARAPDADPQAREKARNAPLRAPLVVVVVARISDHPKVPALEQRLSAGCSAHAILLAAEALGYAGVWRTGDAAYDPEIYAALGLGAGEEIVAFLYIGTRASSAKALPAHDPAERVEQWHGLRSGA